MQIAAVGEPVFKLKNAAVTLNFGVDKEGKISLIARADAKKSAAQELKLSFISDNTTK